ncbi:olfactory receptor 8B3-like [Ovis aries]|uniref:olfactory receptor 8B3-like n=1 Tax=Ovis aries TaxID=9940 RepID=UPI0005FB2A51|nr:olfactory receptor 8B3-like [Ovis aries]
MYMVTVLGNLGLIMIIALNSHLHTPMDFFLFNLSFIYLCYSYVFTPKMLNNFLSKMDIISYMGCKTQLYFFHFFIITECYLLTPMAYDCYVAICKSLFIMLSCPYTLGVCSTLMLVSYLMAFSDVMVHTECILRLTFCDANNINHYFCDVFPLLKLSCTGSHINELVIFIVVGINIIVPSFTIFVSYGLILTNIFHISSIKGRSKTFSTCYPHIIAVSLLFGSYTFMYLKPSSAGSMDERSLFSVYTNVLP